MAATREEQGRMARAFAFWSFVFFAYFGSSFLHTQLSSRVEALREPLGGLVLPIVSVDVNGAFLISLILFCGLVLLIYRWQQKPKVADLLTETEGELKKVTWPTMPEVINSSIVVVVFVLTVMGFLAGVDWFLGRFFRVILL